MTGSGKEKLVRVARFLSPLRGFAADEHEIEYRRDAFTGVECRINVARSKRVKQVEEAEEEVAEMIKRTREGCFFCPERLKSATPKFTGFYEGRIVVGSSCAFPNLFPFGKYHAVVTFSEDHFLDLHEFSVKIIESNLKASIAFVNAVHKYDRSAKYPIWNWNHLPSAAASIIHPHVQVLVEERPTPFQRRLLENSRTYFEGAGRNYWAALVEEEKAVGERFIGEIGSGVDGVVALASFAPLGNNEVMLIFKGVSSLANLNERQIRNFAECLVRVLRCYKKSGVNSFNVTTFSGSINGGEEDYYSLHARIISRPRFRAFYTSDTGFMERFHYEWVIETMPEDVAERMRKFF
ncbi:hypothetical protein [Candidatus Alkanophaga liquidiphilum]